MSGEPGIRAAAASTAVPVAERFTEVAGYTVHCWEGGAGFPILMLHGTGPGTSAYGNFFRLFEPLAGRYRILAADLIGFGGSARKAEPPFFDVPLWIAQGQALLDSLPPGPVGIFGHSLSGALALRLAAANPRVTKVLTTGAIGTDFPLPPALETIWTYPESRDQLRRAAEALVFDASVVTEPFLDDRWRVLQAGDYRRYFSAMFHDDKQSLIRSAVVPPEELGRIGAEVVMLHGRDDGPAPWRETTLALGQAIPRCDVTILGRCGHSPSLEHPRKVLDAAYALFG